MTLPRFIQIHSLASYPAALINRDDSGMAKRLPFGGSTRTRISSQSLKRHWRFAGERTHEAAATVPFSLQSLGLPMGERTKDIVHGAILPAAITEGMAPAHPQVLTAIGDALLVALYGDKGKDPKSRQALFFGHPEVDYLTNVARDLLTLGADTVGPLASDAVLDKAALKALDDALKVLLTDLRKNLRALAGGAGLESALFGRMVTSDTASNKEAPVHVAHAFTVHAMERDLDFATAVDDLRDRDPEAHSGSAGMFDVELTSGLFYGYVNIDVTLLVANLGGDTAMAGQVISRLLQLIARVSPGAKKGSTAPFAHAEWLMVEQGDDQPRTLANAFRKAVVMSGKDNDVFADAMQALQTHLSQLDAAYGQQTQRAQMSVTPPALANLAPHSLAELVAWVQAAMQPPAQVRAPSSVHPALAQLSTVQGG